MTTKLPANRLLYRKGVAQILEGLHSSIPERLTKTRKKSGKEIRYVPWHVMCRLLDYYAPGWSGHVVSIQEAAGYVVVVYQITIATAEGDISRQAAGQARIDELGDPVCIAEERAFKRACAKFGLGLDLYDCGGEI